MRYPINFINSITIIIFPIVILSEYFIFCEELKIRLISEIPIVEKTNIERLPYAIPEEFSGPDHLEKLSRHCFYYQDKKYKYSLCPFSNVTQEEIQSTSDHYKGILGIWGQWIIEDNKFHAMHFIEGSSCGFKKTRSIKIILKCGNDNKLYGVEEPERCLYEGYFETPLFCGTHSLSVYPRLSIDLQNEWNDIFTEKVMGILTSKGYEIALKRIFMSAGYFLTQDAKSELIKRNKVRTKDSECKDELEELKLKVFELEEKLKSTNISNI